MPLLESTAIIRYFLNFIFFVWRQKTKIYGKDEKLYENEVKIFLECRGE